MNPADLNPTIAVIGAVLLAAIGLLATLGQRPKRRVQPARDLTWIDQRIATDTKNRAAWRAIRRMTLEEENES
ncbi:hypothetical protein [Streptomyces sp. NPDC059016]|uniref:hypothetical protein n=1 Tax=Streptomyces sp. NPDC059016 TaxID=3346699 RepID=UPI0036998A25